ncbi:short-chain fatty acyl-CoA regulator family protein [Candidimonas nitroreducens]|uniref:Cro/Cl family transcriptional regulator n=1 Tax=Candidimonas nitroreducens TaxID=683354 RepID=A0A225MYA5_9BURK|nr:short-chain fatty acyl-CoA regulator family protein [Candidimonas nitroreducens]OWT66377.1 Cro/Cl family transcriptional regulator [Candidimonas nitroreducens]
MRKIFMGVRLRRLREERKLTQVALARLLGLSSSYLNQLEQNQRPLTMAVLLRLSEVCGVDIQAFSDDAEARMVAALREVITTLPASPVGGREEGRISQAEIREIAASMPAVGRALIQLHRRHREAVERLETMAQMADQHDESRRGDPLEAPTQPYEEARDFFFTHHNHFAELDAHAERCHTSWGLADAAPPGLADRLAQRLSERHKVVVETLPVETSLQRVYDPAHRRLGMSPHLEPGQQAFQMATQLAFLESSAMLDHMADAPRFSSDAVRRLVRIGLANYFAAALILPYKRFLEAAEALHYDVDLLGQRFGVSFETICHRLSTMQRPEAQGVPFFFIRVDRAGNISKRQSAAHFHFSRVGGACPLWNVYEAFSQPGRILRQLARMPDGRVYLWVARTVSHQVGGFGQPGKVFAVALGCDVEHAHRLVYAKGLDLYDPGAPTPIGMGCRVCERPQCPQRAFPYIGRRLDVSEDVSGFAPYPMAG